MEFRNSTYVEHLAERIKSQALARSIEISDHGLVLGAGTRLARFTPDCAMRTSLAIEDQERVLALLSILSRRLVSEDDLLPLKAAVEDWLQGRGALANIRLAQSGLPRLRNGEDVYRLLLAEELLDEGMSPQHLLKEVGLLSSGESLRKYDPNQTRVPAGNGRASGRWGPGSGSPQVTISEAASPPKPKTETRAFQAPVPPVPRPPVSKPPVLTRLTLAALRALAIFATRFSIPTAVLGALIIPTPNTGGVTSGTLPDQPDVSFQKDGPAGTLWLIAKAADGGDIVVAAQNRGGAYVDVKTGETIGHDFGEQFVLDIDAVQQAVRSNLAEGQQPAPDARAESKEDEPKLCPAPTPDAPHGSSEAALDYEDDVHARVNPLAPLPRKFGVNAKDPLTGATVFFDDCFRYFGDLVDGDMQRGDFVEAKGRGFEWLIKSGGKREQKTMNDFFDQAEKELRTARAYGRGLKWYFAEPFVADYVREEFGKKGLGDIVVATMLPRKRK